MVYFNRSLKTIQLSASGVFALIIGMNANLLNRWVSEFERYIRDRPHITMGEVKAKQRLKMGA